MNYTKIKGFFETFDYKGNYNDIMKDLDSVEVIKLLSSMNAELNYQLEPFNQNYQRNEAVKKMLFHNIEKADKDKIDYGNLLIDHETILNMIIEELNNFKNIISIDNNFEFSIVKGYLATIDKMFENSEIIETANHYETIWPMLLPQFMVKRHYAEGYQLLIIQNVFNYLHAQSPKKVNEFLLNKGFDDLGGFINAVLILYYVMQKIDEGSYLKKYFMLNEQEGLPSKFLDSLSIKLNKFKEFKITDIDIYPLFKSVEKSYIILDYDKLRKYFYNNILFDFAKMMNLKFGDFKTTISKEVTEKITFSSIMNKMTENDEYEKAFDNEGNNSKPDFYCSINKNVAFIELKDSFFEVKTENKSYEKIKQIIDSKFIHDGSRDVGIGQFKNQLKEIYNGTFCKKDTNYLSQIENLTTLIKAKDFTFYPILCYTDYLFALPGVNEYLNNIFMDAIKEEKSKLENKNIIIKNVTLIPLEIFYEIQKNRKTIEYVFSLIDEYWDTIGKSNFIFYKNENSEKLVENALNKLKSFDEEYRVVYRERDRKN